MGECFETAKKGLPDKAEATAGGGEAAAVVIDLLSVELVVYIWGSTFVASDRSDLNLTFPLAEVTIAF